MTLIINNSQHWQIPGGRELHIGDQVEVMINNRWIGACVEYRPRKGYTLLLDNGEILDIHDDLTVRVDEGKNCP